MSPLIKNTKLKHLYRRTEEKDLEIAIRAYNFYRRFADCLEVEFKLGVESVYQWHEEKNPNHHYRAITPLSPIGLIKVRAKATEAKQLLANIDRDYRLKINLAANCSGGFKKNTPSDYLFEIHPSERISRSFELTERELETRFGNDPRFKKEEKEKIEYIVLEGFDKISQGKFLVELGETPREKQKFLPRFKQFGLVPSKAIEIYP